MLKESRYILRRILIGVGIVLVLGFIRSGKVKALTSLEMYNNQISPSIPSYCENKKKILTTSQFFINLQYPNFDISYNNPPNPSRSLVLFCFDTDITDFNFGSNLTNYVNSFSIRKVYQYKTRSWSEISGNYGSISNGLNFVINGSTTCPYSNEFGCLIWNNSSYGDYITSGTVMYSDFDKVRSNDIIYYDSSINFGSPTILSLQQNYVLLNNVIIGFKFAPKFNIFDLSTYSYQYKQGHDSSWISLSENEQELNFNQNGNLYFRIIKNSDLSVVYNLNYTITSIGENPPDTTYDIKFSYGYDTGASGSSQNNIILKEYVDIDYIPNASNLKYQYQFVVAGNSIDNNNWTTLPLSANAHYHFETNVVGSVYARILDNEDNILLSPRTFYFASIGKIAINNNNSSQSNFFSNLSRRLNFNGPISGIITLPIRLAQTIATGVSSGSQCSPFPLGSLLGTNLYLPCVNVKNYLGVSLYTTIDLICACVMIYYIFKMFGEMYTNLLFMEKNPIHDLGRRGD